MSKIIGINLGTTNSWVAVMEGKNLEFTQNPKLSICHKKSNGTDIEKVRVLLNFKN